MLKGTHDQLGWLFLTISGVFPQIPWSTDHHGPLIAFHEEQGSQLCGIQIVQQILIPVRLDQLRNDNSDDAIGFFSLGSVHEIQDRLVESSIR